MRHIKKLSLFESRRYKKGMYYKSEILEIIDKKWINIQIDKTEIEFEIENELDYNGKPSGYYYVVYLTSNGKEIMLEDSNLFCEKLNKSMQTGSLPEINHEIPCINDKTKHSISIRKKSNKYKI